MAGTHSSFDHHAQPHNRSVAIYKISPADRPRDRALRQMAEAWSPWRSVAARALWAYYRVAKDREGIR